MTIRQMTVRLMCSAAILVSVGCASRSAQNRMANSGSPAPPSTHTKAQLLAAARQYEKEGRPDLATRYYRQVLALEPDNGEAADGLDYVQAGRPRTQTNYKEIVASSQSGPRPRMRTGEEFARSNTVIDERTAQLIANAAAAATAEAIANAANKATAEYVAKTATATATTDTPPQRRQVTPRTPVERTAVASTRVVDEKPQATKPVTLPPPVVVETVPQSPPESQVAAATHEALTVASSSVESQVVNVQVVATTVDQTTSNTAQLAVHTSTEPVAALPNVVPQDWNDDSRWQTTSLTRLCHDANAAVLREVVKLDSEDPEVRMDGLQALARMGRNASTASLAVRMLLHDKSDIVRAHAAWSLWEITGDVQAVVESLSQLLYSSETEAIQHAAYTLSGIGNPAHPAVPMLQHSLSSEDQLIQLHAAEALARISTSTDRAAAIEALIMLTAQPSAEVRTLALLALGRTGEKPTSSMKIALTSALHDSDPEVRSAAALTLGGFGPAASSAISQLEFVAENDQPDVKQAANTALQCIRRQD
ncbi:MAG: HEAT repeat domain-containing protein [Planctomycetaceae bacterium]|nr:HEAT repeat domain-containing protein [Planctomycetaceae bacterium]